MFAAMRLLRVIAVLTPDNHTEALLEKLENVPFFVGVANGGIHTFVGHKGNVCDFHWTAQPDDKNAMTENPVRQWKWDTGLYMVRRVLVIAAGALPDAMWVG